MHRRATSDEYVADNVPMQGFHTWKRLAGLSKTTARLPTNFREKKSSVGAAANDSPRFDAIAALGTILNAPFQLSKILPVPWRSDFLGAGDSEEGALRGRDESDGP